MSVQAFFDILPKTHIAGPTDYLLGFSNTFLTALVLVTPYSSHHVGWKLFRIGIAAPVIVGIWLYLILTPLSPNDTDQWGIAVFMTTHVMRSLEWLIFFPAEEHCHRLRPKTDVRPNHLVVPDEKTSQLSSMTEDDESLVLVPEPIPPPFTWAKFWWACSLWWSFRGVGWNFCCALSPAARRHPFTRSSSRRSFLIDRIRTYILSFLIFDMARTYMNTTHASAFFSGIEGIAPSYDSLTTNERALHSIAVAVRIWYSMQRTHIEAAVILVSLGGLMGWEGEIWSPWGWPSVYGSLGDLWKHPGLSTMWSRTWSGYNRRWLYVFGWIGIGENILGLTHTGISSHPHSPVDRGTPTSSRNSPNPSGHVSPSHPLPSGPPNQLPRRSMSLRLMTHNLIKSFIVFGLSGLMHDVTTVMLLVKYPPGRTITWPDLFVHTPFFVIQPVALAVEAGIKSAWRGYKIGHHPEWQGKKEPQWLVFLERAIGFAWTWIWLGWTAHWFVKGITKLGAYRRGGDRMEFPSLFGGLWAGKWTH